MGERFGERIRRVRKGKGLGLRETAARVGISAPYLSRVETGGEKGPPGEEAIRRLAWALGDDFDILMQLAGRIPADVADYVTSEPGMLGVLRAARDKGLSANDIMELISASLQVTRARGFGERKIP